MSTGLFGPPETVAATVMEILNISLDRLADVLRDEPLRARHGVLVGRFFSRAEGRPTIGDQKWPYDYLVVVREGRATARDGSGTAKTLTPGVGALWRAQEHWRVDVLDDCEAVTLQAALLDATFLELLV